MFTAYLYIDIIMGTRVVLSKWLGSSENLFCSECLKTAGQPVKVPDCVCVCVAVSWSVWMEGLVWKCNWSELSDFMFRPLSAELLIGPRHRSADQWRVTWLTWIFTSNMFLHSGQLIHTCYMFMSVSLIGNETWTAHSSPCMLEEELHLCLNVWVFCFINTH